MRKTSYDWNVYNNRKSALQHLKHDGILVDTVLQCEDGISREIVHSQVMSALSDTLTNYINQRGVAISGEQEKQLATKEAYPRGPRGKLKLVVLPEFDALTLSVIVDCAYSGYLKTDLNGIWKVLHVADYYNMQEVIKASCTFLISNLNQENCIKYFHVGAKHNHPLQRSALCFIRANFKHILASNLMQIPGFFEPPRQQPLPRTTPTQPAQQVQQHQLIPSQPNSNQQQPALCPRLRQDIIKNIQNCIATLPFEHFEFVLNHDKINIDDEESCWYAIRLWVSYEPSERSKHIPALLSCIRFPRMKSGSEFINRFIWKDPLIRNNKVALQHLAHLDSNNRELMSIGDFSHDGYNLPCSVEPKQVKPRIPHAVPLAIGGWQQGTPTMLIESFDINCNLWFQCKQQIQLTLAYHGIEYINGLLYICGGTDGSEILNELFTFNPIRGDCQQKLSMRESRCYVSTAYINNSMYAMGGHNGMQRMKSVERFDIHDEVWLPVTDMNVARSDASACIYNSLIYIAGGLNDQVIENSVEFYNYVDDTWTSIASMMAPRTSFALILYHDTLLAIGGNNGSERLASVEQYRFDTKTWRAHSMMKSRRSTFSAALIESNKLIVAGGYNGSTPFNKVEMYDERTCQWITMKNLKYDRSGLKLVVINDLPNAEEYTFVGHNGGVEFQQTVLQRE